MALKATPWDPADHLDGPAAIAAFLVAAFEDGDPAVIGEALGAVARSKGMMLIADRTGLSRESLYKALSRVGNPEFSTIIKVLDALDLRLVPKPKHTGRKPRTRKLVTQNTAA